MPRKYSVFLGNVGTCFDRYCDEYAKPFTNEQLFERLASIDLLAGVGSQPFLQTRKEAKQDRVLIGQGEGCQ